ncbi:hypothetical protein ACIP9C_19985 [Lysinibacillus sp. NPDC093210]|uniref:hypothetical protein n=1 Tax=Lysinibacillus sp. NPDC093210 TaxID=3364133 RepID=UPI0038280929
MPTTSSFVSTPVLVATADTPAFEPATDVGGLVKDYVVEPTTDFVATTIGFVVLITDFALTISNFVVTVTDSVGVVADTVVLSATGSLHIEKIFF